MQGASWSWNIQTVSWNQQIRDHSLLLARTAAQFTVLSRLKRQFRDSRKAWWQLINYDWTKLLVNAEQHKETPTLILPPSATKLIGSVYEYQTQASCNSTTIKKLFVTIIVNAKGFWDNITAILSVDCNHFFQQRWISAWGLRKST